MAFTNPCFVQVNNKYERTLLLEWLRKIGYNICKCCEFDGRCILECSAVNRSEISYEVHCIPIDCKESDYNVDLFKYENSQKSNSSYDCGTNIELFKAIAAMNDKTCFQQWFTDGKIWALCEFDYLVEQIAECDVSENDDLIYMIANPKCHQATIDEIIEHFKV